MSVVKSKTRKKQGRRGSVSKRWVAISALLTYGVATASHSLQAQSDTDAEGDGPAIRTSANSERVHQFDISQQVLSSALAEWEHITGRKIKNRVPTASMSGLTSAGVNGILSERSALESILKGTGLELTEDSDGSYTLSLPRATTNVDVHSEIGTIGDHELSLNRFTESINETPTSITVVPHEVLQQQGATTLRDALRNVPGISLAAGEGGVQGDNLTIRGFSARSDIFLDGMRDFGSYYRDPFNYERIEVLQGPEGVMFGRGSTGGVVEQDSKMPEKHPFIAVEADGGTDITKRLAIDINEPLHMLPDNAIFRLNLMAHESNVAERNVTENRRFGIAPVLAFGEGTPTRLKFSYLHQQENDTPDYGLPFYFNEVAPVNRRNYYGFTDDYLRTNVDVGTFTLAHDFNAASSLRNRARYGNYARSLRVTEPQLSSSLTTATPLSEVLVTRSEIEAKSDETYIWDQLDSTGQIHTGFIQHDYVIGIEGGRETSAPVRFTYSGVPTTSFLNPDEHARFSYTSVAPRQNAHTLSTSFGVYLVDTMKFGKHFDLVGGARWDYFNTDFHDQYTSSGALINRLDDKPSWRAAAVYKPTSAGSIYFDYGTSWNPSADTTAFSLTAALATVAPEANVTYEAGTKWDLGHGEQRLNLTAAVFRTDKTNAREPSPTNPLLYTLAGSQRVDGVQFQATGNITNKWQILTGYIHMKSQVLKSPDYPVSVGAQLANVPGNEFNLWTTYMLPKKIQIGGGTNYVDSRTASSTAPYVVSTDPAVNGLLKKVPSYWIGNLYINYPVTERISLQANVYNFTNTFYIDQPYPYHLVPGEGANALFTVRYRF